MNRTSEEGWVNHWKNTELEKPLSGFILASLPKKKEGLTLKMQQESSLKQFKRRIKTKRYRIFLAKRFAVIATAAAVAAIPFCIRGIIVNAASEEPEIIEVVQEVEAPKISEVITYVVPEVEEVEPEPEVIPEEVPETVSIYDVPLDLDLQLFIIQECEEHHIDPAVIIAMIQRESTFKVEAIGDNGNSFGLMQIQPRWHSERMNKLGCTDLLDPYQNVAVGIDFLAEMLDWYDGDMAKALTAYNQGTFKGVVSNYASGILANSESLKEGMIDCVL